MNRAVLLLIALLQPAGCGRELPSAQRSAAEGKRGFAAEGWEVVLCTADELGERLTFAGRVLDYEGRPLSKAAVIAYQADHTGLYNPSGSPTRVPRLRGVAVTDEDGKFRFSTIRPGPYPNASEPAHIHLEVAAPGHRLQYVTYWFEGDPLITDERRAKLATDDETVVVELSRGSDGIWTFVRDIQLAGN